MSIETTKIDLVQRLLTVDDEEILHRIEALLDSNFAVNPDLQNSIKEGLDDMKKEKFTHILKPANYMRSGCEISMD